MLIVADLATLRFFYNLGHEFFKSLQTTYGTNAIVSVIENENPYFMASDAYCQQSDGGDRYDGGVLLSNDFQQMAIENKKLEMPNTNICNKVKLTTESIDYVFSLLIELFSNSQKVTIIFTPRVEIHLLATKKTVSQTIIMAEIVHTIVVRVIIIVPKMVQDNITMAVRLHPILVKIPKENSCLVIMVDPVRAINNASHRILHIFSHFRPIMVINSSNSSPNSHKIV